ncbi:MAG: acylneuraminate cytidylyltransferase family protein [Bacillota bacterium]|nr:acylneuraminate cytidylyltransferase family protein [Bacillota bacterium]
MNISIIPARGGSKGLKRKNIANLRGKPLIAYTIEAALKSKFIDKVIVSTDDEEIAEVARKYGADVPFIRPNELATDTASSIDVVKHAILFLEAEMRNEIESVILLQPTSPLRDHIDIDNAFKLYLKNNLSPVVSVCPALSHPFLLKVIEGDFLVDFFKSGFKVSRRQDLPEVFELNGAIYITTRELVIRQGMLYLDKVIPYVMSNEKSVDIDTKMDFLLVETILQKRRALLNEDRK